MIVFFKLRILHQKFINTMYSESKHKHTQCNNKSDNEHALVYPIHCE